MRTVDFAFLELTSHCNFKCTFCPSNNLQRKKMNLPYQAGEKFIKQINKQYGLIPIHLNVLGEPLLNHYIFKYFDLCRKLGNRLLLITNYSLLDEKFAKKLFSYDNFTLVLSLQTPTKESFKTRGNTSIDFKEYISKIDFIIEQKFLKNSDCSIEIHIASNHNLIFRDSSITSEINLEFLQNFYNKDEELDWLNSYVLHLEHLNKIIKDKYNSIYENQLMSSNSENHYMINTGCIAVHKDQLPHNFFELNEDEFWGFMALPKVFLRSKSFGLWTKDEAFLKSLFAGIDNVYLYVAEKTGEEVCTLSNNIGILSNGEIIVCCLDYENEMNLGNINRIDLSNTNLEKRTSIIRKNVLNESLCRRCRGHLIVALKENEFENAQELIHYSYDWHPFEPDMNGIGGRWSQNISTVYVYSRLNANLLSFKQSSPYNDDNKFIISIYKFNNANWELLYSQTFLCSNSLQIEHVEFSFVKDGFYKIELLSPTFCPQSLGISQDSRNLGVAVFSMTLS